MSLKVHGAATFHSHEIIMPPVLHFHSGRLTNDIFPAQCAPKTSVEGSHNVGSASRAPYAFPAIHHNLINI